MPAWWPQEARRVPLKCRPSGPCLLDARPSLQHSRRSRLVDPLATGSLRSSSFSRPGPSQPLGLCARSGDGAPSKHVVTYSVTGSGSSRVSHITYLTHQGEHGLSGEGQVTDATLPWTRRVVTSDPGPRTSFSVRVVNGPTGPSYVICSISEDGKLLSSQKAEGPYAVAACGSAGYSDSGRGWRSDG